MSFLIKIDVKNNVPNSDAQTQKALEEGVKEITDSAFSLLVANTPVRTGFLRSSYQKIISGLSARIISTASYIMPVERGSKPHLIVAKNARALHFFIDGEEVFVKSVKHPSSHGRFFIQRTAETVRSNAPVILAKHLANVGKGGS